MLAIVSRWAWSRRSPSSRHSKRWASYLHVVAPLDRRADFDVVRAV